MFMNFNSDAYEILRPMKCWWLWNYEGYNDLIW